MTPRRALTFLAAGLISAALSAVVTYKLFAPEPAPESVTIPYAVGAPPPGEPGLAVHATGQGAGSADGAMALLVPFDGSVSLFVPRDPLKRPIDATGSVLVSGVAPGKYWVWVESGDRASCPVEADVSATQHTARRFTLGKARRLSGVVVGRGGAPVSGARVTVELLDPLGRPRSLFGAADTAGAFVVPPVAEDWCRRVTIIAETPPGTDEPVRAQRTFDFDQLPEKGPIELDLTVVTVRARCVNADGRPVVDGTVFGRDATRAAAYLDAEGHFELHGDRGELGSLRVFANEMAPRGVKVQWDPGKRERHETDLVDLGDLRIDAGTRLAGTLTEAVGTPCANSIVELVENLGGDPLSQTNVSATGEFSLPHVAAGTYRLVATVRGSISDVPRRIEREIVHPAAEPARLVLPPALPVTLRFVEGGRPSVVRADSIHVIVRPIAGGAPVAVGRIERVALDRLQVFVPAGGPYECRVEVAGYEPNLDPLSVRPGEPNALNLSLTWLR